jgi:hypothetical protein
MRGQNILQLSRFRLAFGRCLIPLLLGRQQDALRNGRVIPFCSSRKMHGFYLKLDHDIFLLNTFFLQLSLLTHHSFEEREL